MDEVYIGDGLYAAYDGEGIRLRAPRPEGDHWVYLDPVVWTNLMKFAKDLGETKDDDRCDLNGGHSDPS